MKPGVVLPQTESGVDPALIRAYAQSVEAMGYNHDEHIVALRNIREALAPVEV